MSDLSYSDDDDRHSLHSLSSESSEDVIYGAILPELGAWAVLTIDPIASLSEDTQQDPEAIESCKKLVNKQYVGLIARRVGLYLPWEPYNSALVRLLSQGEPRSSEELFEPSMSLPVLPVTTTSHPSAREPLQSSKPLPWSDCYLTAFRSAKVRSRSQFSDDPVDYQVEDEEMFRHEHLLIDDRRRWNSLKRTQTTEPIEAGHPIEAPLSAKSDPLAPKPGSTGQVEIALPVSTFEGQKNGPTVLETSESVVTERLPPSEPIITATFSHDLSLVAELNDPSGYFEEVAAIFKIEEEARPRVAAAKARAKSQAIALAMERDTARYDRPTIDLLIARDSGRISPTESESSTRLDEAGAASPVVNEVSGLPHGTPTAVQEDRAQVMDAPDPLIIDPTTVLIPDSPRPRTHSTASVQPGTALELDANEKPVDTTTDDMGKETVNVPSSPLGRVARAGLTLKKGGKTVTRYITHLFCISRAT
ncbi:hypothetical protein C8R46DRAFT_1363314 [Mycena filopes]|nr:hypothetical protein C8R46DRAFT_1363314 [Mycena filopes]